MLFVSSDLKRDRPTRFKEPPFISIRWATFIGWGEHLGLEEVFHFIVEVAAGNSLPVLKGNRGKGLSNLLGASTLGMGGYGFINTQLDMLLQGDC
jgi:hypothetical protein